MPRRILDSHHHLWDYDPHQYPWIDPALMSVLAQSYGLANLREHTNGYDVQATIAVQARQTLEETDWLLKAAKADPLCAGVVGWVPLKDKTIGDVLARYADQPLLKGVRHVIQDEDDPEFMLGSEFVRGINALGQTNLRYDLLIFGHQLPNTIKMVDQFPDQPFVLDHIAKPVIDPAKYDKQWAEGITELARRSNVCCKLSGMATEVRSERWDRQTLQPYFDHVLQAFGPDRLMFGSDWPVCLLRTEYANWARLVDELIDLLSPDEQDRVMYLNAKAFYGVLDA